MFNQKQTDALARAFSRNKPQLKEGANAIDELRHYSRLLEWESCVVAIGCEIKAYANTRFDQNRFDHLCGYDPADLARDHVRDIRKRLADAAECLKIEANNIQSADDRICPKCGQRYFAGALQIPICASCARPSV